MNLLHRLKIGIPSVAVLCALSAAPGDPNPRGRVGENLVPLPAPATADHAWAEIAALIDVVPELTVTGPLDSSVKVTWAGYIFVQEVANRTLREVGLRFWRDHPSDPRRWTWLAAVLDRGARYVDITQAWEAQRNPDLKPASDEVGRVAWEDEYRRLRDLCIASPDAPDPLRIRLWVERIEGPLTAEMWARVMQQPFDPSSLDFEAMCADLRKLSSTFPDEEGAPLRNVAYRLLSRADKYAPEMAARWRAEFERSPNVMLRHLAAADRAISEAKVRPMEMKFTAIDGREVDLKKLRGKVVLIDFRGVTWCGACREEEPYMKEVYAKYHGRGFEIITITFENKEESRDFVKNYVKERGLVWPHYFDGRGSKNPYIQRFGITGVPQHFLIDQSGLLVRTDARGVKLEAEVKRLLNL